MIRIMNGASLADAAAQSMFADRKRLFVDLLGWDVPVVGGHYEIDTYDGEHAIYVIALDEMGTHIGSMRLLPTTGPHLLADLFAYLCEGEIPHGIAVREITRLCLPVRLGSAGRLSVRNALIAAMVDHALADGIRSFTGVVTASYREQVLSMGWRAVPLGPLREISLARRWAPSRST